MCWDNDSTKIVSDCDDTWKKGYVVKFLHRDTLLLADKWCHSRTDCYKLHTVLHSDSVASLLSSGYGSHFTDFGFNIFPDIKGALGYRGIWYIRRTDGANVVVECWYRYVTKKCITLSYGDCVAAKEMILCYVHPNQASR